MQKKSNKSIIAVIILLVLVIGAIIAYFALRPAPRDRHPEATPVVQAAETQAEDAEASEAAEAEEAAAAEATDSEAPAETEEAPAPAEADLVTITVEVTHGDESKKEFTISTEALNLRGALEQEDLIQGDESEYGLYVKTVDGETADDSQQQWWCFTRGGEMLMTGVDDTEIADGDHYEIVLTTGW